MDKRLCLVLPLFTFVRPSSCDVQPQSSPPPPASRGWPGVIPKLEDLYEDVNKVLAACPPAGSRLVLGLASFPQSDAVYPFVRSWRQRSPHTHMVLVADNMAIYDDLHSPPDLIHVIMVKPDARPSNISWNNWRLFINNKFLEACSAHRGLPAGIMTSDTRDSIALGNIWSHLLVMHAVAANMVIFTNEGQPQEDGRPGDWLVGSEAYNTGWVRACFEHIEPPEALAHVLNSPITCAGTVIGGGKAFLEYTRTMVKVMTEVASAECMHVYASDQGVHNWIANWMSVGSARSPSQLTFKTMNLPNGESPIYTMGMGGYARMTRYGVLEVPRKNWTMLPMYAHQYDRNEAVTAAIKQLYNILLKDHASLATSAPLA